VLAGYLIRAHTLWTELGTQPRDTGLLCAVIGLPLWGGRGASERADDLTSQHRLRAGLTRYPHTHRLLITADGGGSNGSRLRLWKYELQQLATETGLTITVCHYPSGTSKWNKIEHRLFSVITQNWRGRPLVSYAVILSLIAATTTTTGLIVESYLDTNLYPTGCTPTAAQMTTVHLERHAFHGDWNYTIWPHGTKMCHLLFDTALVLQRQFRNSVPHMVLENPSCLENIY